MGDGSGGTSGAAGSADPGVAGQTSAACEPGAVDSCWETPQGAPFEAERPEEILGACLLGERKCGEDGAWASCLGAIAPEAADSCTPGNDANCNGVPNEDCPPCTNDDERGCGLDTGNCQEGTQTCTDGAWGECAGEIKPAASDRCDTEGDDANCNGTPNDGCSCIASQYPKSCLQCGTQACDGATGTPGACVGNGSVRCVGDVKQACGANGNYADAPCPSGSVCRDNGTKCLVTGGGACLVSADCLSNSCQRWYLDCDDDGFAASTDDSRLACSEPPADSCGGGWTTKRPIDNSNTDCLDSNKQVYPGNGIAFQSKVIPNTTSWDWNCDKVVTYQTNSTKGGYGSQFVSKAGGCVDINQSGIHSCNGAVGWTGAYPECGKVAEYVSCVPYNASTNPTCAAGKQTEQRTEVCY